MALGPVAVWIAVSADAYFGGVAAWGVALLALASARTICGSPTVVAVGAGILLGCSIYLDYGLILMGYPLGRGDRHPQLPAADRGGLGVVVVASRFTALGFWWFDGLSLVRQRYWSGIATDRPFSYWVWGNLASLTCAIGVAAATGLRRAFNGTALRTPDRGINVMLVAFVLVIVAADLTGLSKAETERIWLPFAVWLVTAPALLPRRCHRFCLGLQAVGALLINSLLLTTW